MLWQIQVVNIVAISGNLRKQNTWRWRAEGRGYCQGSPGRQWRGWRHHWCRTPTASPPRRRPSESITAAPAHSFSSQTLNLKSGLTFLESLSTEVAWPLLWHGSLLDHVNVKGHQDSGYTRMVLCLSILVIVAHFKFTMVHFWSPTFSASLLSQLSENQLCRQVFRFPLFES